MPDNLFLKYNASDTGARPLPPNTVFWESPAVVLATSDGNYTVGQPATIDVQVNIKAPTAYEIINVEVWVCDPTTVAGPSTALPPFMGATSAQLTLTGFYSPPSPSQAISAVPVIQVSGFIPYPNISSLPGGHCCLIANCYGLTGDGTADGVDLNEEAAANLPNLVQTNDHVAQHNIFADVAQAPAKAINFPFRAATPLLKGGEVVTLQISQVAPALLKPILPNLIRSHLKAPLFAGLPIELSARPVRAIGLSGAARGGHEIQLQLGAHQSHVLTAQVELDPAERPGALHAFDVVQKDARGHVQGGFRLLTAVGH